MKTIQLETKHLEIVNKILKDLNAVVYVFGSRAKNTAKPLSDLDLCLKLMSSVFYQVFNNLMIVFCKLYNLLK
jgi:predicted nucleotidyltransferase